MTTLGQPRRGWRERIEAGIHRIHRVSCPSTRDQQEGRRCGCAYELQAPGHSPGRTRTITFKGTITEARVERRRLLSAGRPTPAAPIVEAGTLDAFSVAYLQAAAPRQSPATIRTTADAYRRRVSPMLGALTLDELTREKLEVWLAELLKAGVSRDGAHKAVKALRVMLSTAVEWGRLIDNPARRLKLPKPAPGEGRAAHRVLNEYQLARLVTVGTTALRVETMVRVAAEAGLRKGEVIGLRWPDVDLAARRLNVERSVWQERGRDGAPPRRIVKQPKGGRPRRVAISETFAGRLGDWYAVAVVEGGADASGYVWPGRAGPMDDATPGQALGRALERAELLEADARAPVTFHGLRHTAASIMLARGVPLTIVARQLGHANPNVTATIYAHLLDEAHLDRAAAVFDPVEDAETLEETLEGTEANS